MKIFRNKYENFVTETNKILGKKYENFMKEK